MKRAHFSSEQIVFALRQAESGTPVVEVCRRICIVEQTLYCWKQKQLLADLSFEKQMPQDMLR